MMKPTKAKGDEDRFAMSRNFLATDKVPDSIFGIPIVSDSDDYTPEDIAFFHSHPEAGGYYDLGEGTPEDGSAEGAPAQASKAGTPFKRGPLRHGPPPPPSRGAYPGSLNNPGNIRWGDVSYPGTITTGLKKQDFLKFGDALSGLNAMGQSVGQMARVKLAGKGHVFSLENLVRDAYARENENDTEGYIKDVSKFSGIDRSAVLDMRDSETMAKLLEAMVRRDSGHPHADWFTPEEYRTAAGWMTRKWENGQFTEDK